LTDANADNEHNEPQQERLPREISVVYGVVLALVLAAVVLAQFVPFLAQNLYALVAAIFVGVPYWWLSRRGVDFERFGLTWERAGRGALWGLLFAALTAGPFALGYWWWETTIQERHFELSADNNYKWPVEYQGRPDTWGDSPGVWVWADGPTLHMGIRSGQQPVAVTLEADEAFTPQVVGAARLEGPEGDPTARIILDKPQSRARISVGSAASRAPPRALTIEASHPDSGERVDLYRGAGAEPADQPAEAERGLGWLLLWTLTQLLFIALPEEFFYRGYLQTRIADALDARKQRLGDSSPRRRVLGISAENALTSLLFGLGHLLIPIGGVLVASRISVFFPSLLFGWLRERTGTIAAPVVYHAAANMMVLLASPHFF
jgi:membrane protease YdiL (CAAX protease family)